MSARDEAAGGVDRWEVVRVDHDGGDISYEVYSSEPYGFLFAIYEDLNSRAKAIADGIVADHNARLSPSPRDQACSAMLGALEKIARIREIDHFGGASMAEEIARAAIAKVALLSSDGDTA